MFYCCVFKFDLRIQGASILLKKGRENNYLKYCLLLLRGRDKKRKPGRFMQKILFSLVSTEILNII